MSQFYEAMKKARVASGPAATDGLLEIVVSQDEQEHETSYASYEGISTPYARVAEAALRGLGAERQGVLLVTSAIAGEGVSTVARNLSQAIATVHRRTLLIDANLRSPSQHRAFGARRSGGLTDVVKGSSTLPSATKNLEGGNLSFLSCGEPASNPTEVLDSPTFGQTLKNLRSRFDVLVLDSPPVNTYPDASSLVAFVDGVILVVEAERTRWEVAQEAVKHIERSGGRVLGGVLNRRHYYIPEFLYKRL